VKIQCIDVLTSKLYIYFIFVHESIFKTRKMVISLYLERW